MKLEMAYDRKGRYYYDVAFPEKKYYSVSTINKWGQPKGKVSDGAKIGTLCHYNILRNYTEEFIEVPGDMPYWTSADEVTQKIDDAMKMWYETRIEDVVEEWLGVEKAIWWEGDIDEFCCRYAGRLDALVRCRDGIVRLVDLKTGDEYDDYIYQFGGYVQAVEHCMGIHVDEVWAVYLDVGSNWIKEKNIRVERNVDRLARIVTLDRSRIEEGISGFNKKLLDVFKNF